MQYRKVENAIHVTFCNYLIHLLDIYLQTLFYSEVLMFFCKSGIFFFWNRLFLKCHGISFFLLTNEQYNVYCVWLWILDKIQLIYNSLSPKDFPCTYQFYSSLTDVVIRVFAGGNLVNEVFFVKKKESWHWVLSWRLLLLISRYVLPIN